MDRWASERLGLEYRHERCSMRNRIKRPPVDISSVENYTIPTLFHHGMRARDHILTNKMPQQFLNTSRPRPQEEGRQEC
jgi:hypothetical protein